MITLWSIMALYFTFITCDISDASPGIGQEASLVSRSNLCRLLEWANKSGDSLSEQNKETLGKLKIFYLSEIERCMSEEGKKESSPSPTCENPLENPKASMSKECLGRGGSLQNNKIIVQTSGDDEAKVTPNPKQTNQNRNASTRDSKPAIPDQKSVPDKMFRNASNKIRQNVYEITARSLIPQIPQIIATVTHSVFIPKFIPPVVKTLIQPPVTKTIVMAPVTKIITKPPVVKTVVKPVVKVVTKHDIKRVPVFIRPPKRKVHRRLIMPMNNSFNRFHIPANNVNHFMIPMNNINRFPIPMNYHPVPQNRVVFPMLPVNSVLRPLAMLPRPVKPAVPHFQQPFSFTGCNGFYPFNISACNAHANRQEIPPNAFINPELDRIVVTGSKQSCNASSDASSCNMKKNNAMSICKNSDGTSPCNEKISNAIEQEDAPKELCDNIDSAFKQKDKSGSKKVKHNEEPRIIEVIERVVVKTVTETMNGTETPNKAATATPTAKKEDKSSFETAKEAKLDAAKKNRNDEIKKKVIKDNLNKKLGATNDSNGQAKS